MRERRHPEQGFRACLGIVRLAKMHGSGRLDAACERALEINARSYASVKSILNNNLERRRRERATDGPAITHPTSAAQNTSIEEETTMLTHPTLDQLKSLKLDGMCEAFAELETQDGTATLSHPEWLALLIDREVASRSTKRFQTRMRVAKLRHVTAAVEDVDYRTRRNLDKALFQQLMTGKWIRDRRNLMVTGLAGWVKPGWPARWRKRPAGIMSLSYISACRACLTNWNWPTVMAASHDCSEV